MNCPFTKFVPCTTIKSPFHWTIYHPIGVFVIFQTNKNSLPNATVLICLSVFFPNADVVISLSSYFHIKRILFNSHSSYFGFQVSLAKSSQNSITSSRLFSLRRVNIPTVFNFFAYCHNFFVLYKQKILNFQRYVQNLSLICFPPHICQEYETQWKTFVWSPSLKKFKYETKIISN